MAKSQRLKLCDLRAIYRLISECRGLGRDPRAWRRHMASELCRHVGAALGTVMELVERPSGLLQVVGPVDFSSATRLARDRCESLSRVGHPRADVEFARVSDALNSGRRLVTYHCQERFDGCASYRSEHGAEYRKAGQVHSCLYSFHPLAAAAAEWRCIDLIALHRPPGDSPFGEWERRWVYCFHHELGPQVGRQLAAAREPSFSELSPRLRQVLLRLLEGDSEKRIARRLLLSRPTVHQYVGALYRHFDSHSRGELLARWIRLTSEAKEFVFGSAGPSATR